MFDKKPELQDMFRVDQGFHTPETRLPTLFTASLLTPKGYADGKCTFITIVKCTFVNIVNASLQY